MFGYSFYKAVKKNTFITNEETRQKRCNCFSAVHLKKNKKKTRHSEGSFQGEPDDRVS